jgi:uncharacterized membrane-anchored protein
MSSAADWDQRGDVYVSLTTDSAGFAKIQTLTLEAPTDHDHFVKAQIDYIVTDSLSTVFIQYPFTRYYMEESKAAEAENIFRERNRDTSNVTYGLVSVKKGQAAITDVIIDGISIKEIIDRQRNSVQ